MERSLIVSACCQISTDVVDSIKVDWVGMFLDSLSHEIIESFRRIYHGREETFLREEQFTNGVLEFRKEFGRKWCGKFIKDQEDSGLLCAKDSTRLGDSVVKELLCPF
jgi:hypothetical protein